VDYLRRIRVEDASGCQFDVHEFRAGVFRRRYLLDTGETVTRIDDDSYVVDRTGETLVRASERDSRPPS